MHDTQTETNRTNRFHDEAPPEINFRKDFPLLYYPDLFTGRATCPRPAVFNCLETAGAIEILSMIGYEKPTDN